MPRPKRQEADWEFIFDGVFGFLSSPLWSVPMMSFIDAQSVVFEPTEENHLEWTEIHNKYRALVESLLTSYLKDVGITEEEFMKACVSTSAQNSLAMQHICEQLFAGEDFEIFKKMMIQRNVELELEALKLIQKRQGKKKGDTFVSSHIPTEEEIFQEVLRRSEEEYNEAQRRKSVENETYNENIEKLISDSCESERLEQDVLSRQEETKRVIKESIEQDIKQDINTAAEPNKVCESTTESGTRTSTEIFTDSQSPLESPVKEPSIKSISSEPQEPSAAKTSTEVSQSSITKSSPKKLSPKKDPSVASTLDGVTISRKTAPLPALKMEPSSSDAANQWMENAKKENSLSSTSSRVQRNAHLSQEDIKKREQYLKDQRNRIQEMKNQEREKQLLTYTKTAPQRPASASVAKKVISGETPAETMSADEQKKLAMRRVLAEKLKKQVVYKDDF